MNIKVGLTQTLELPKGAEIVDGPSGKLIKLGDRYYSPRIEYMRSKQIDSSKMTFYELEEAELDLFYAALLQDSESITEC